MAKTSLKTYKEWLAEGREVKRWEKPHGWTWNDQAVYYQEQTKEIK